MNIVYTQQFLRQYDIAPVLIQREVRKQITFLISNLRHPSLRAKKYDAHLNLWQARVTRGWRFYFTIQGDTYYLAHLKAHPK